MDSRLQDGSLGEGLSAYLKASHDSTGGWLRDSMLAAAAWLPGLSGMAFRSLWHPLWLGGGSMAVERGVRILGAEHIHIGKRVYLDRGVYLHGRPGGLHIGDRVRVMAGAMLHVYNFRDLPGAGIKIGSDCVIGLNAIVTGQGGVKIGNNVIVAPGAMILPVNHNFADPDAPVKDQGITGKGIEIGNGAWIGAGAKILDGVKIGDNAVIGAGSVVTSDVPSRSVYAGNPARPMNKDNTGEAD